MVETQATLLEDSVDPVVVVYGDLFTIDSSDRVGGTVSEARWRPECVIFDKLQL